MYWQKTALLWIAMMCSLAATAAGDWSDLPAIKKTRAGLYMTPSEASEARRTAGEKTILVDIRTRAEAMFVGMPTQADALVPYVEIPDFMADWDAARSTYAVTLNNDFLPELKRRLAARGLGSDATIILICRSGDRSSKAADLLASQGYTRVFSVPEGFEGDLAKDGERAGQRVVNGWKNAGLPWSYKLDREKLYFPK